MASRGSRIGFRLPTGELPAKGALLALLPELAALQGLVEDADWHEDDPFEQALRLHGWLRRLPASLVETVTVPVQPLDTLLAAQVDREGRYTAHQLLAWTALIHDVGKAKTFEPQPDGTTRSPDHEAVGARIAAVICTRFDLTPSERDFIVRLVAAHGKPYETYKQLVPLTKTEQRERLRRFEGEWGDDLMPLLLLAYGDLVTSHLRSRRPAKYAAILGFYQNWLVRLVGQLAETS